MKARKKELTGRFAVGRPASRDEAVLDAGGLRCESVLYDGSEDGYVQGTYLFERNLPAGAVVFRIDADVQVAATSAGAATYQLKAGSTDLTDATAFDDVTDGINSAAVVGNIALASSAEGIKLSSASELKLAIAGADLTAGKVRFFVQYLLPND